MFKIDCGDGGEIAMNETKETFNLCIQILKYLEINTDNIQNFNDLNKIFNEIPTYGEYVFPGLCYYGASKEMSKLCKSMDITHYCLEYGCSYENGSYNETFTMPVKYRDIEEKLAEIDEDWWIRVEDEEISNILNENQIIRKFANHFDGDYLDPELLLGDYDVVLISNAHE